MINKLMILFILDIFSEEEDVELAEHGLSKKQQQKETKLKSKLAVEADSEEDGKYSLIIFLLFNDKNKHF